jgi:hypothetical protein
LIPASKVLEKATKKSKIKILPAMIYKDVGIDIKCSIISSILKEILQSYNNEKSHDFNEDSLRTQLRMIAANFPPKDVTKIKTYLPH